MAASMIGWFGDGNGYVGNLNLNPEVAHTIAATAHWSDPTQQAWDVKLTPYYYLCAGLYRRRSRSA